MTIRISAAVAALFLATAASAAERPFGQPSEPTVYGHAVAQPSAPLLAEIDLRREAPVAAEVRGGFTPSEPTVWGHRPDSVR